MILINPFQIRVIIAIFMVKIFPSLNRQIGLDLGSSRIRIWVDQLGVVLDEPSLLAVDQTDQRVVAVGRRAQEMQELLPQQIKIYAPLIYPRIKDSRLVTAMLRVFLQRASRQAFFFSPTILVSLPANLPPVIEKTLVKILSELGAKEVGVVKQSLASAIGAGVPVADPTGSFLIQLGFSQVEASALALGKVVADKISDQAGWELDKEIQFLLKDQYKLRISQAEAQRIKQQVGCLAETTPMTVFGQDILSKKPTEMTIETTAVGEIGRQFATSWQQIWQKMLSQVSPALSGEVLSKGIILAGGLSQFPGLEEFLLNQLQVPVFRADQPDLTAINGVALILKNWSLFKNSLAYQR